PVSRLELTGAFQRFVVHLCEDAVRFAAAYNRAVLEYRKANRIRSVHHPAPLLRRDQSHGDGLIECPFWYFRESRAREPVMVWEAGSLRLEDEPIRPRALTLTLFARVCLGDLFIHGIGGGKYDEVTDAIIRDYFGLNPPAYQVLSATLHLPLPAFPSTTDDVDRAEQLVRDLTWNPQRYLPPEAASRPDVAALVRRKAELAANEPPYPEHAARRQWFWDLRDATQGLRPFVAEQLAGAE